MTSIGAELSNNKICFIAVDKVAVNCDVLLYIRDGRLGELQK